MALGLINVEKC